MACISDSYSPGWDPRLGPFPGNCYVPPLYSNATTSSSWPPVTVASIVKATEAFDAKYGHLDRELTRFDGTLDEFKAGIDALNLRLNGGIASPATIEEKPPWYMANYGPLGMNSGLEVRETFGFIYVGTRKAIKALEAGERFAIIGTDQSGRVHKLVREGD